MTKTNPMTDSGNKTGGETGMGTSPGTEVACTLTTKGAATQVQGWEQLRKSATTVSAVEGGARLVVPADSADQVEALIAVERTCCSFLDITTTATGESITVEITTEHQDGLPIVSLLAGIPLS